MKIRIEDMVKEYARNYDLPSQYRESACAPYETFIKIRYPYIFVPFLIHLKVAEEE